MGKYIDTATSLYTSMIGVTNDTLTTNMLVEGVEYAEQIVDSYISSKYDVSGWTTPSVTPPIIKVIAKDIAKAYGFRHNSRGSKDMFKRADMIEKRAIDTLVSIRDCDQYLLDSTGAQLDTIQASSSYGIKSTTDGYQQFADYDDIDNWKVDDDQLDDIDDSRDD